MKTLRPGGLRRRARSAALEAAGSAGEWASESLPALGAWIYAHTRFSSPRANPAPKPRPAPSPGEAPPPTDPGPTSESADLPSRLLAALETLVLKSGAEAAFVADDQGLALASTTSIDTQVAASAALDRALAPVRATLAGDPLGSVTLELEPDRLLQIIWLDAGSERLVLGLLLAEPLAGARVREARERIHDIFEPRPP